MRWIWLVLALLVTTWSLGTSSASGEHRLFLPLTYSGATPTPPYSDVIVCDNHLPYGHFETRHESWLAWQRIGTDLLRPVPSSRLIVRSDREARSGRHVLILGARPDVMQVLSQERLLPIRPADRGRSGDLISAELSFWMRMVASDGDRSERRSMTIYLESRESSDSPTAGLAYFNNRDAHESAGRWKRYSYDVTAEMLRREGWSRGAYLSLVASTLDSSGYTGWLIDDIKLTLCLRD